MLNRPLPTEHDVSLEQDFETDETVFQTDEQTSRQAASPVVSRGRPRKRIPAQSEHLESLAVEVDQGAVPGDEAECSSNRSSEEHTVFRSQSKTKRVKPRRRKDIAVSVQSPKIKERSTSMECLIPGADFILEQAKLYGQSRSSSPGGTEGKVDNNSSSFFAVDLARSSSLDNLLYRSNSESSLNPLPKPVSSREGVRGDVGVDDLASSLVNSKAGSSSSLASQPGTSFSSEGFYSSLKRKHSDLDEIPRDIKKKRLMKRLKDISTAKMPDILPSVRASRSAVSGRSPAVSRESSPGTLPKMKGGKFGESVDRKEAVVDTNSQTIQEQHCSSLSGEFSSSRTSSGESGKKDDASDSVGDGECVMDDDLELMPGTLMANVASTQSSAVVDGNGKGRPKEPPQVVSDKKDYLGRVDGGFSRDVTSQSLSDGSSLETSNPTVFRTVQPSFGTSDQQQDSYAASTTVSVSDVGVCKPKRPRGRPRIHPKIEIVKRGPGRPKGSLSKSNPKRKPGRPRKTDSQAELNVLQQSSSPSLASRPLRRRRGRRTAEEKLLQKHWRIGADIVGPKPGVKRGPGRPRKIRKNSESATTAALASTRQELIRNQSSEERDVGSSLHETGTTALFESDGIPGSSSQEFINVRSWRGSDKIPQSRRSSQMTATERRKACPTLAQMRMRKKRRKSRWATGLLPKQSLTAMNKTVRVTKQSSISSYFALHTFKVNKHAEQSKEQERVLVLSDAGTSDVSLVLSPSAEPADVHLPQIIPKTESSGIEEPRNSCNAEFSDVKQPTQIADSEHVNFDSLTVPSQPKPVQDVEHTAVVSSDVPIQSESTAVQSEAVHNLQVTSVNRQPQVVPSNQSSGIDQSQVIPDLTQVAILSMKGQGSGLDQSQDPANAREKTLKVAKPKGRSRELKRLQTDEGAQKIMSWHEKNKLKSAGLLLRSKTKDDEPGPKPGHLKRTTYPKDRKSNKQYSIDTISDTRFVFKSGKARGKEKVPAHAQGMDLLPAGSGLPGEELAVGYEQAVFNKFKRGVLSTSSSLDSEDRLPPIITEVTPFGDNRSERSRSEELSPPPLIRPEDPYSEDYFLSMPVLASSARGQKSRPLETVSPEVVTSEVDIPLYNQAVASDAKADLDTAAGIDNLHRMETSGATAALNVQTPVKLGLKRKRGRPLKRRGARMGPASKTGREPHVKPGPASSKPGRKPSSALKMNPTYTQNTHYLSSEPRTFALRPKTTRSPLEIIAMRQKQEEEKYELQEATRLARLQKRRQAQFCKLVVASEPAFQPLGACRPCSVVLVDFVKKLHLHSIDTSDQYVSDVSYDSDEQDVDDEYDGFSDADYDPVPDEVDVGEGERAEPAAEPKATVREHAGRKPRNAAHPWTAPKGGMQSPAPKELVLRIPTEVTQKRAPTVSHTAPVQTAPEVQKMGHDLDSFRGKGFLGNFVDFIENRGNHESAPFAKQRYTPKTPKASSNASGALPFSSAACNLSDSLASRPLESPISASLLSAGSVLPPASVSSAYQIVTTAQIHDANRGSVMDACPERKAVRTSASNPPVASRSPLRDPESSKVVSVRPEDEAVGSRPSKLPEPGQDVRVSYEDEAVSSSPSRAPEHGTEVGAEKTQIPPLAKPGAEKAQAVGKLKVFPTRRDGDSGALDKTATIRYLCTKCDFSATNKGTIESHVYRHIPGVNFKCGYCESEFTGLISALTHVKNSHNSKDPKVWISKDINEASLYTVEEIASCSVPSVTPPEARHQKAGLPDPAASASQICESPAVQEAQQVIISLVVSGDMAMQRQERFSSSPLASQRRFACTHCSYSTSVMEDAHQHVRDLHRGSSLYTCYLCDKAMGCSLHDVLAHCEATHPHRRNSFKKLPDFYDQELIRANGSGGDHPKPKQDRGNIFDIFENRGFSGLNPGGEVMDDGQQSPQARFLRARDYLYIQEGWSKKTSAEADSTTIEDIEIPLEDASEADTAGLDSTSEEISVAQQLEESLDGNLSVAAIDKTGRSVESHAAIPVDCTVNNNSLSHFETVDNSDKRESAELDEERSAVDNRRASSSSPPDGKEDPLKPSSPPEVNEGCPAERTGEPETSKGPKSLPAASEGGASSFTPEDVSKTSASSSTTSSQLPDRSQPTAGSISSAEVCGDEAHVQPASDEDVSGNKVDAVEDPAQTSRGLEPPVPHPPHTGSSERDEAADGSSRVKSAASSATAEAAPDRGVTSDTPAPGPSDVSAEADDDGDADGDILVINLDDDVMEDESCSTPE